MRILTTLLALFLSIAAFAQPKIILDTDFGNDADDLGALSILNNLENRGECEVLAVMSYFTENDVIAAIDAVNLFYGNEFPLAISSREYYTLKTSYNAAIVDKFKSRQANNSVPLCCELYRKILSSAEPNSITLVVVGPLGNIRDLYLSPADEISPLTGAELLQSKVKSFAIMGGGYPSMKGEWNFNGDQPGTTKFILESLPHQLGFVDYEVGSSIKIGDEFNSLEGDSPLKTGFAHFSANASWMKQYYKGRILDNSSFDQIALYLGIYGAESPYYDMIEGERCIAEENGDNQWVEDANSHHTYMRLKSDLTPFRTELYELMTMGL